MEVRLRRLLLACVTVSMLFSVPLLRAQTAELDEIKEIDSVIQPDIKRKEFDEAKIGVDNFEFIPSLGILSIEDFGTNLVINLKLQYHVSEDFFVGAEYGRSQAGKTSHEVITGTRFMTDDERVLNYYLFTLGYNMLPGEAFVTDKTTFHTALYTMVGIGSVDFAGDSYFDFVFGAGYRLLMTNHSSVYLDIRDHLFNSDILGEDKMTHNLELTLGYSFYF